MKLELRDVRFVYAPGTPFEVEALRGVSLAVEPGEVLGLVGGTGSGKSTLVRHMNLLLVPTIGEVLVDGVDAMTLKKSELRRRVGLVFQFPEAALFAPTVKEDVAFAPRRLGLNEAEVHK
ncbi:MAG: ATP-binding cassette domain-containing protein, partial [Actinomycetota bacterium]|nr:ATP-binding cassette domain-containing protein [Actinomycetota bacterium]